MYCPSCRSEFREGINHCANCDVELVHEQPDEDGFSSPASMARALEDKELVAVLVGNHVALQEAQRGLAGAQVASIIAGDTEEDADPGLHARFYLMVDAAQHERARTYFQARWEQGLEAEGTLVDGDGASAGGEGTCPACGSAVPDDAEECPECELYLGTGTSD